MTTKDEVSGRGRGHLRDAAEKWLAENDPDYHKNKRLWQQPSSEALARNRKEHKSLEDLEDMGAGSYRRPNRPKRGTD